MPSIQTRRDGILLEAEISRARDDAKGVDAMRKAVKARPLWAIAHNNLASGLGLLNEYDEAIRAAREASKLDPALDTPHWSIATARTGSSRPLSRSDSRVRAVHADGP